MGKKQGMLVTKYRLTAAVLAAFLVFTCMLMPLYAESGASNIGRQKVKVGCIELNGFFKKDRKENCSGLAYDIFREISTYTGQEFEFVKTSQSEGLKMLNEGTIDLFVPVQKTAENQNAYMFSTESFAQNTPVLLAQPGSSYCYNDFDSINGITVGTIGDCQDNEKLLQYLQQHNCRVKLKKDYTDFAQMQEALNKGEINALLTSSNRSLSNCKVIAQMPCGDIYAAAKKGNTRLMDSINYALQQMKMNTPHFWEGLDAQYLSAGENVMPAYTKEEAQFIAASSKCVIAVNGEFQHDDEWKSIQTFAERLQQKTGLQIKLLKTTGLTAAYDSLSAGSANAVLPVERDADWAQANGMWLSQSFLSMWNYQITKNGSTNRNTLAVVKGSYQAYDGSKNTQKQILYCDTLEQAINMVLNGQADAASCSRMEGDYFAVQTKYSSKLLFTADDSKTQEYAIGISKKSDSILVSIFNKAIGCMPVSQISSLFAIQYQPQKISTIDYFYQNPQTFVVVCVAVLVTAFLLVFLVVFNAAAKKKNKQLESASRAKSDFLARMSHDLRTPMNAIVGLAHLGEEECKETAAKSYFEKIKSSSVYLLSLINDILDMSRIENKKVELHPEPVNWEEFWQAVCTIVRPAMDEKNLNFIVEEKGPEMECLYFDRIHMQQILINLLSNAIKFSRSSGRIRFTYEACKQEGKQVHVRFSVRDYGIGMSEAFMHRIFAPFEQEHNKRLPEQTGTGLGLAIVKNLVDMMHGTISVNSELGEGSEFTVELTLREVQMPEKKVSAPMPAADSHLLAGVRVLLAEDHPLNTEIACKLLQKQGVLTEHAENGKLAVQMFQDSEQYYYDAILMDIRMPMMNGLEAAQAIRKLNREDAKTVPIIAMSANAFDEDVRESLKAGMNAHLAKPIVPAQLYAELEKWTSDKVNQ